MFSSLLCLSVPPSIRDSSGDSPVVVNVLVGKSVTLECESNAVPPPTVTWYKNGRVVTESVNLRILSEGQMLEIKGSEVRDEWMPCCLFLFSIIFILSTASFSDRMSGQAVWPLLCDFFLLWFCFDESFCCSHSCLCHLLLF